jgi:phosphoribosylglycinamide formyltransferase-1
MIAPDRKSTSLAANDSIAPSDVLYVAEASPWGKLGCDMVAAAFPSVQPIFWSPGMPKPDLSGWHGDWIISFKADLILPRTTLEKAGKGAINFHPSPPKYRGLGGYWWALRNRDMTFGVTAHHMDEHIDHGEIVKTNSFPIWPGDTVDSLKHRAAIHSLMLLSEILVVIVSGQPLVSCGAKWGAHLFTQKELLQAQGAKPALVAMEAIHDSLLGARVDARHDRVANPRVTLG